MIQFHVPSLGDFRLEHLVMDVNGMLAVDGQLIEGVAAKIAFSREQITIHLLTADTHGRHRRAARLDGEAHPAGWRGHAESRLRSQPGQH